MQIKDIIYRLHELRLDEKLDLRERTNQRIEKIARLMAYLRYVKAIYLEVGLHQHTHDIDKFYSALGRLLEYYYGKKKFPGYHVQQINIKIDQVKGVLATLTDERISSRVIGKGFETQVKEYNAYFLANKVIKRIIVTENKRLAEEYRQNFGDYKQIMNNLMPEVRLVDAEAKVYHDRKLNLYVVYIIQDKFNHSYILYNILQNEQILLEIFRITVSFALKMFEFNEREPINVAYDFTFANMAYYMGRLWLFDYNVVIIDYKGRVGEVMKFWELVQGKKKPRRVLKYLSIPYQMQRTLHKNLLNPKMAIDRIVNFFYMFYHGHKKGLKEKLLAITQELVEKSALSGATKKKLRKIKIRRYRGWILHGGWYDKLLKGY